jgi:hypothetical protein
MPSNTRGKLHQEMDAIENSLINTVAHCRNILFIFQEGEQNYQTHYAENIVMIHSLMEAAHTLHEAFKQYKREYM